MKVIITQSFEKNHLKKYKKYFSKQELVKSLKDKQQSLITLHEPFFKYKNNIKTVAFRGVVFVSTNNALIPLCFFLKKDKQYGNNITWQTTKEMIEKEFSNALKDLENGNFEVF